MEDIMKRNSKKLNLGLLSLLTCLGLTACNPKQGPESTISSPSSSVPTSSSEPEPEKDIWAEEDLAHVNQAYTGSLTTGSEGIDLSRLSSAERASILGDVEAWALKNHLLGIPLYGDGGWTLLSTRIKTPVGNNYVVGYGFGVAREGKITSGLPTDAESNPEYSNFLHEGLAEPVAEGLNPFDSNNTTSSSLISDLTATLYAQRLVKDGNGGFEKKYEWYPSLAESEPVPGDDYDETTKAAKTWNIKVRNDSQMQFHIKSAKSVGGTALSSFDGKKITAKSFVDAYRILLNKNILNSYASQYIADYEGAEAYNTASENVKVFTTQDDALFANVGIKALDDTTLQFKFKSPQTKTGVYLKTSLSPCDADFFKLISNWSDSNPDNYDPKAYGRNASKLGADFTPKDTFLCSGPYYIDKYESGTGSDSQLVFKRNDNFIDRIKENNDKYEVYAIPGIVYNIKTSYSGESGVLNRYNDWLAKKVDSSSIPQEKKAEWEGEKPGKYNTGNGSVAALQVNSTTPERWDAVFGKNGANWSNPNNPYSYDEAKAKAYVKKPVLSNSDFLDGLYFSVDRVSIADALMANPSSNWLAEAYVMDLDSNVSYDETAAHKRAIKDYLPETYGYNRAVAQSKFKSAMDALVAAGKYQAGTATKPTEIHLGIQLYRETQKTNWGTKVAQMMEETFNSVCLEKGFKLVIEFPTIPANPMDSYAIIASGCYDLAMGGISGGTADAFGMVGCYLDSFDYGFQLSVGPDTNADTGKNGIKYNGKSMSMQAAFYAIEMGSPVLITDGKFVGPVPASN